MVEGGQSFRPIHSHSFSGDPDGWMCPVWGGSHPFQEKGFPTHFVLFAIMHRPDVSVSVALVGEYLFTDITRKR